MSDFICRKSMMRCQTPGMCSPHGGCRPSLLVQVPVRYSAETGATVGTEGLKPCPFCGDDAQLEKVERRSGTWYGVICRGTRNHGGTCAIEQVPSRTQEAAVQRWNMRRPMDVMQAEIDRLQALVKNNQ